jgi:hypothetical protein
MFKSPAVLLVVLLVAVVGISFTSIAATDKAINVTASVNAVTNFTVQLFPSLTNTTYDWAHNVFPAMSFGMLTNANASDPSSALASSTGYVAYVSIANNNGALYHVDFQGAPLTHSDGTTKIPNDAFVVSADSHYYTNGTIATINTGGIVKTKKSAGLTTAYTVYNSNAAGASDGFDMFFGLTGDSNNAIDSDGNGVKDLIPPTQKSGTYSSTLHVTLYP